MSTSSHFVKSGYLDNTLYLFNTDTILSELAVVPELDENAEPVNNGRWLVVHNRLQWLEFFEKRNNSMTYTTYESLYSACPVQREESDSTGIAE